MASHESVCDCPLGSIFPNISLILSLNGHFYIDHISATKFSDLRKTCGAIKSPFLSSHGVEIVHYIMMR